MSDFGTVASMMNGAADIATGEPLDQGLLDLIQEVVANCSGLTRKELAATVCELADWKRASGRLKTWECQRLLEQMEEAGKLALPAKKKRRPKGSKARIPVTRQGDRQPDLVEELSAVAPIELSPVVAEAERRLFRELVGRHHYLGHAVAFGAQLRYLVHASRPSRRILGCIQFSSPAWRMAARDAWIGWDDGTRKKNLQRIVSNSRFLLLPWIHVANLASHVLSLATTQVARDWPTRYGVELMLVETLVDPSRYRGGCYRAANWIHLGETSGRGRMDRAHRRHGEAPKSVFVYPLVRAAARRLREDG